jgi:hypothetical protein
MGDRYFWAAYLIWAFVRIAALFAIVKIVELVLAR